LLDFERDFNKQQEQLQERGVHSASSLTLDVTELNNNPFEKYSQIQNTIEKRADAQFELIFEPLNKLINAGDLPNTESENDLKKPTLKFAVDEPFNLSNIPEIGNGEIKVLSSLSLGFEFDELVPPGLITRQQTDVEDKNRTEHLNTTEFEELPNLKFGALERHITDLENTDNQ